MKSTISEIKNVHDGITNRLDMAKKKNLVYSKSQQHKLQKMKQKKRSGKKRHNFPVQKYQAIKHTYNWSPRQKKKKRKAWTKIKFEEIIANYFPNLI